MLTTSPQQTLPDACAAELRRMILSGELAPGERLPPERALAERFSVNRVTLRSALARVAATGLLDGLTATTHWLAAPALARRLMDQAETGARALGLTTLRLDTNRALPEAIAMYHRLGWTEIDRFNDDPYAQVFFEKRL